MMLDVAGSKYGRLTAIQMHHVSREAYWECLCDCGNLHVARLSHLRQGGVRSCGCLPADKCRARSTHNASRSREFRIWVQMRFRCSNQKYYQWPQYGGRGIRVCERWKQSFETFYKDMGPCPVGFSIDRKDNLKGYTRANCRWVDARTQSNNRWNTCRLTYEGQSLPLGDWSRVTGIPNGVLHYRLKAGWPAEAIIRTPVRCRKGK